MNPNDPLAGVFAQGIPYVAVGVTLLVSLLKPILEDLVPPFSPRNATLHDAMLRLLVFVLNILGAGGWEAWAGHFAWSDALGYVLLGVSLSIGSLGTYHLVTSGGQSIATAGYSLAATVSKVFTGPSQPAPASMADPSMADPSMADPGMADPSMADPSMADPGGMIPLPPDASGPVP